MSDHSTLDVDRQRAAGDSIRRIQTPRGIRIAIAKQIGRFAGHAVGLLMYATLSVLEPFVRLILMTLTSLGMFVTIVFGFLIGAEGFPKWFMLGMSAGCFLALGAFYGIMSFFCRACKSSSRDWPG